MKDRAKIVQRARQQIKEEALGVPTGRERFQNHLKIAGPILNELAELGYEIDTLDDLRHQGRPWKTALPTLLRWLPNMEDPCVKDSIVRGLSVPWAGNTATAELIDEFRKYAPILPNPTNPWVGNKLVTLSDEEKKAAPFFHLA